MKEKVYIDRMFANYEDSAEIKDFKEEIAGNLKERIKELVSKGYTEEESFEKATEELGDITALADDVGKKKRNEAIGQMYIGAKVPVSKQGAISYAVATGLLLFGIIVGAIVYYEIGQISEMLMSSAVFIALSGALFTIAGLTTETTSRYPMKIKRAIWYGVITGCGIFGLFISAGLLRYEIMGSLGVLIAFLLPSICVLIFLLITEEKREKPWLKEIMEKERQKEANINVDPAKAARFGVASAGLWILATAFFVTMQFGLGWSYSWVVYIFMLALQVFMVAVILEKTN